ncbi:hypothetical protein F5Y16DRAFT_404430 [Xylariaceae sp. FL0255]|nr:hypothetical protein F5Y16DRAFT_404430 [Xylariaceae sp. FL0255]
MALGHAYRPPPNLEDGVYLVDPAAQTIPSAKFASEYSSIGLVRIGDIIQPAAHDLTVQVATGDNFTNHPRNFDCHPYNTMVLADYMQAMSSFHDRCNIEEVPERHKHDVVYCTGRQAILFAKAGSAIVYHCNASCQKQHCGGGHIPVFEQWADKRCGKLKGAWFYSSWDFTMGRDVWGGTFCDEPV